MRESLNALAARVPQPAALDSLLATSLHDLPWGSYPGLAWLTDLLDSAITKAGVRFGSDLLLFRKVLFTLRGLLADLLDSQSAAEDLMNQVLLARSVTEWAAELPQALLAPTGVRSPRTHLSTGDWLQLMIGVPAAGSRWWVKAFSQLLPA
jgi:hypothetical protein